MTTFLLRKENTSITYDTLNEADWRTVSDSELLQKGDIMHCPSGVAYWYPVQDQYIVGPMVDRCHYVFRRRRPALESGWRLLDANETIKARDRVRWPSEDIWLTLGYPDEALGKLVKDRRAGFQYSRKIAAACEPGYRFLKEGEVIVENDEYLGATPSKYNPMTYWPGRIGTKVCEQGGKETWFRRKLSLDYGDGYRAVRDDESTQEGDEKRLIGAGGILENGSVWGAIYQIKHLESRPVTKPCNDGSYYQIRRRASWKDGIKCEKGYRFLENTEPVLFGDEWTKNGTFWCPIMNTVSTQWFNHQDYLVRRKIPVSSPVITSDAVTRQEFDQLKDQVTKLTNQELTKAITKVVQDRIVEMMKTGGKSL